MISKFAPTIKDCYLSKKIVKGCICGSGNSFIPSWAQGAERLDKTTVILGDAEDIVVVIHEQN